MAKSPDFDFSAIEELGTDVESYLSAKYDGPELERLRAAIRGKISQNLEEARKRMEVVACLRGLDFHEEGQETDSDRR